MRHSFRIAFFVVAAALPSLSSSAEPPDAGKLIELLQASFGCPLPVIGSGGSDHVHYVQRYIGDTSVFRVNVERQFLSGDRLGSSKYEIAFNFRDIASVRVSGNDVTFICKRNAPCIAQPRRDLGSQTQYSFTACRADMADNVRFSSEHLIGMNADTPERPIPTIWVAPKAEPYWMHNGSTVDLVAQGALRKFYYREPSRAMIDQGVMKGTLLFAGRRAGSTYSGVSYLFSSGCPPLEFSVEGLVSPDDRQVTLQGRSPRRTQDCRIVDHRDVVLAFTFHDE